MKKLFTERHGAVKPRSAETLDAVTRDALLNLVWSRMDEEWFGYAFPSKCMDGYAYAGTDFTKLQSTLTGYGLPWPRDDIDRSDPASDGPIFDLIEFSYEYVAEALDPKYHSYGNHSHYSYDQEAGRRKFSADVNRIFERNGSAFHLVEGEVARIAPAILDEGLAQTLFHTGDAQLDKLLQAAREKFLNRALDVRREALEKLWDAWERLKTLEPAKDKKASVKALLDRVSTEPTFRERLETEAAQLTEIGNKFMIRHSEIDKIPVADSAQVDYLFHRMFAFIRIVLNATGRGG